MKTLLIITPHMSTGGCPQVVAKKVELLKDYYNVVVVEWECVAWLFVVQRNRVIDMIGDKFISLSENKEYDLFNIIEDHKVDYVMIEEFSETFIPTHIMKRLYSKDRQYKIFETTHCSYTDPNWKKFLPDKFIFVSPHSLDVFKDLGVPMDLIEYPIDIKTPNKEWAQEQLMLDPEWKHIINIGLFTSGKNQGYAFEIARLLQEYKIMLHFIGNQANSTPMNRSSTITDPVHRIEGRRAGCRVQGGQKADYHRGQADGQHIYQLQAYRQRGEKVDISGQFNERILFKNAAKNKPQYSADGRSQATDHQSLEHENPTDIPVGGADGF